MIARGLWVLLVAAIGLIAAGAQLDRQSRATPAIAEAVPEPFRAFAQEKIAEKAVRSGPAANQIAATTVLVTRRPIPAEHLRLLAQAQFAGGQEETGAVAIQLAAQRGWRDPLAQVIMLELALAANDKSEAARRYLALLLKQRTDSELLQELGAKVFASPADEAEAALVDVLAGGGRWQDAFLRRAPGVIPPTALATILNDANARGTKLDCGQLRRAKNIMGRSEGSESPIAVNQMTDLIERQC